jgi:DNA-binding protein H-NS
MTATFAKKQAAIQQLKEKLEEYTADEDEKLNELQAHNEQLAQAKSQLTELLHNKKNLVNSFREKRVKVSAGVDYIQSS